MNKSESMLGNKTATCEVCGNVYDKCFELTMGGQTHVFDSFECAIHALGPPVPIAAAASSVTAWRRRMPSFAAPTAPASMA